MSSTQEYVLLGIEAALSLLVSIFSCIQLYRNVNESLYISLLTATIFTWLPSPTAANSAISAAISKKITAVQTTSDPGATVIAVPASAASAVAGKMPKV